MKNVIAFFKKYGWLIPTCMMVVFSLYLWAYLIDRGISKSLRLGEAVTAITWLRFVILPSVLASSSVLLPFYLYRKNRKQAAFEIALVGLIVYVPYVFIIAPELAFSITSISTI